MNKVVEMMKKSRVFYVATIDGNQPRVRPFSSVCEFENEAYLCSGNFKEFYKQIKNNPNVEITGMIDDVSWLRISATLSEDDRVEVQKAMLDDETGPKGLYQPGDGKFVTFKLANVKAFIHSFVAEPKEIK